MRKTKRENVLLEVKELEALRDKITPALKKVSFQIRGGEILGIAGVANSGQRELAEVISGLRKATGGKVYIQGKDMTNTPPIKILERGFGHIPEDRTGMGLIMNFSVADNLILGTQSKAPFAKSWLASFGRKWFLDRREIEKNAEKLVKEFEIKAPNVHVPVKNLSKDNLQKLIMARELSRGPKVLIVSQPTKGIEPKAAKFLRNKLEGQRKKGVAILLISEDLEELISMSDRIAVMHEGDIVGVMPAAKARIKEIGLMMAGISKPKVKATKRST